MTDAPTAGHESTDAAPARPASRVVVRYRTTPDRADENQSLVEDVFAALDRTQPDGLRYATFRLDDGLTFVHVATVETVDGVNPLQSLEEFATFTATIGERCEQPPEARAATLVGAYRCFGEATDSVPVPGNDHHQGSDIS